ncbi:hypothetical protein [Streptomyces sp. NPDC005012]|uniref:hypothetical protein n=1 Tax=Streptomyces sp. NPDC005012 TaxID=3154558 RepID=UPI0033A7FDDA
MGSEILPALSFAHTYSTLGPAYCGLTLTVAEAPAATDTGVLQELELTAQPKPVTSVLPSGAKVKVPVSPGFRSDQASPLSFSWGKSVELTLGELGLVLSKVKRQVGSASVLFRGAQEETAPLSSTACTCQE